MPEVWNQNSPYPSGAVYIGRPSKWGNPFKAGVDGTRKEVIRRYRDYLFTSGLINDIHELKDRHLVCYCKPKACHGDVLIELANPFFDV